MTIHSSCSESEGGQVVPSLPWLQVRDLLWTPGPHVSEHSDQALHSDITVAINDAVQGFKQRLTTPHACSVAASTVCYVTHG